MERTKEAIIRSFGELLEERPFNKITVRDIVERCGITRNAFYYHFQDIPTLFQQVMDNIYNAITAGSGASNTPIDCFRPILQFGLDHRKEALHTYRYVPRERLMPYLNRAIRHMTEDYFGRLTGSLNIPAEDLELLEYLYECAVTGAVLDWLDNGMDEGILDKVTRLCEMLEGTRVQFLAKYEKQ